MNRNTSPYKINLVNPWPRPKIDGVHFKISVLKYSMVLGNLQSSRTRAGLFILFNRAYTLKQRNAVC